MAWFRRKHGNRRLGREQVLDVKLRASKVRAARMRAFALVLSTCFSIALVGWLVWRGGEWILDVCIYKNKAFAIQTLDVQTDGVISVDQLKRWTGVRLDQNLLALDLGRVRRNLELIPAVKTVSIQRSLPGTLRIRVTERVPMAQASVPRPRAGGGIELAIYHLDDSGCVMLPLDPLHRDADAPKSTEKLPTISGLNPNQLQPGRRVDSPQLGGALALILAFDKSSMAGLAELKRVDVSALETLVVTTSQGSEITFALGGLDHQLARWREINDAARRAGKIVSALDLAVTNNIPARWIEASNEPLPPAKPTNPQTPRKKHV